MSPQKSIVLHQSNEQMFKDISLIYSIQLIPLNSFHQVCVFTGVCPKAKFILVRIKTTKFHFSVSLGSSPVTRPILEKVLTTALPGFNHIVWTYNMRRLAVLVGKFGAVLLIIQMNPGLEVFIAGCWIIGMLTVPSQSSLCSTMYQFCAS
jgi:hypothetical protein